MISKKEISAILDRVTDPEVPVLNINDLGIVRDIQIDEAQQIEIFITPTYSGCPAMNVITVNIKMELLAHGFPDAKVTEVLSPAWTTDWMSESGKMKLNAYGIAPPQYKTGVNPHQEEVIVPCPQCNSRHTRLVSQFGSTPCKALYKCLDCLEPFDYFKCH